MGLRALIIAALGAAAILVFMLLVLGFYFPETLNRYCRRFAASITGLFVLAAVIPIAVLGISAILFINYHLSPSTNALVLEFWLNAAIGAVLLTAFVATLFAIILARRITLPLSALLDKAEEIAGETLKEVKGTGGTIDTMAEIIESAADELSSARDYTSNIISSVAGPLIVVDGQWRVKTANRAFLELIGYNEGDVTGRPFDGFYEKGHFKELLYEVLIRQGGIKDLELFLSAADGEKIPVAISASPVMGRDGEFVILARDLRGRDVVIKELEATKKELSKRVKHLEEFREGVLYLLGDLEKSEQELSEAYKRLKGTEAQLLHSSKLSSIGQLSVGMAHELNQPLTVIRGLAQNILKKGSLENEKLKLIDRAARRMEGVIKHLRVFARADEPSHAVVDLNRVIEEAFIMVKQFLKRRPAVGVGLDLKTLPPVTGSASRLEQVFINLMTNAKDAMPEGGVITISTGCVEREGRRYVIATFRDTGKGIPGEFGDRIFDPFFTTKQPGKGTGLGLSISHDIIKDHGGGLRVLSTGGEGTAFEITLPARA